MARNPEIEAILNAWWELSHGSPNERHQAESKLNSLLDAIVSKSDNQVTRDQIKDFLWPQYKAFRTEKRRTELLEVAQEALKPKSQG